MRGALLLAAVAIASSGCDRVFGIGDPYEDARAVTGSGDAAADSGKGSGVADAMGMVDASFESTAIVHFPFDGTMIDTQNSSVAVCSTGNCDAQGGGHVGFGSLEMSSSGCVKFPLAQTPAQWSLAMWVYPNSGAQQTLIAREYAPASPHVSWKLAGSMSTLVGFTTYDGTDTSVYGSMMLGLNTWQHFVVTYDGQSARIYINAQPAGALALTLAASGAPEVMLGCDVGQTSGYYTGNIDDVFIFDRALVPAEITALYNLAT